MLIDWDMLLKIVMPCFTLILGAWIKEIFEAKVKLISHYGHVSAFKLKRQEGQDEDKWVYTHSVIIKNSGKKTADNVRLGHNVLPDNYIVHPDIEYSVKDLPGGCKELVFPKLIPKKEITISYLYFPPLTYGQINSHIESDSGPGKVFNVLLQPIYPKWVRVLVLALMAMGVIAIVYLLVILVAKIV